MSKEMMKQLIQSDDLVVGISELSKMTDVSPRQLRYWEEKGYIESIQQENSNRKYRLPIVLKVELIKRFLDEGYTLTTAVEKAANQQKSLHEAKKILRQVFKSIQTVEERYTVLQLADFDCDQQLFLIKDNQTEQVTFQVAGLEVNAEMLNLNEN